MELLITLRQNNIVTEMSLQPLVQSKMINKIYVVRDYPANELPKVEYYCPWKFLTKSGIIKTVSKLMLMIYLTISKNPDVIVGYQSFPHSVNAFICGKIFHKPVVANIMGSPKNWHRRNLLLPLIKNCNMVSTTGSKSRDCLVRKGVDKAKIFVLPDSIDTDRFYPMDVARKYDIISIGRLSPEKNIETLLGAISKVKKIKKDITVGIVGDGPSKESLEKLTKELGITDNVDFLGFKDNTEFYYNSGKMYVLTSVIEGLPMAMLEAMACGLPCVVSNVGDVSDIAKDGENAIVIDDPYDVDGFAKAIIRLLNDDKLYKKLSENTKIVREKYCYESATKVWNEILDSIGG